MIVTTTIDLTAKTYRCFLHKAEKDGITPEQYISRYLEMMAENECAKQRTEKVCENDLSPLG